MDFKSLKVYRERFWLNPVLFLEVSRVKSGISRCALPQKIFEPDFSVYELLNNSFVRFLNGECGVEELYETAENFEEILSSLSNSLTNAIHELNLHLTPVVVFVNRVLTGDMLYPEIQFFVSKNPAELKRLKKIEMKILEGKIEFRKGKEKLMRIEGKILGYPECCVDKYIESKKTFPAESRLIVECIESGIFNAVLDAFKKSKIVSIPQFFTSNFYPCSVECKRAERLGLRIEEWIDEYGDAFRLWSMVNVLYHLAVGYKASKVEDDFGKRLKNFYSGLEIPDKEIIRALFPYTDNLTRFANLFIARVLQSKENQKN
uniref:DUF483 domain-containing protein n=1 Tax=Archaeoglobus fulgidus TaxID=2234 RepID=A0A7C3MAY5_ARCFL